MRSPWPRSEGGSRLSKTCEGARESGEGGEQRLEADVKGRACAGGPRLGGSMGARGAADARIAALTEERPGEQSLGLNWNGVFDVHGRDTIGAPR